MTTDQAMQLSREIRRFEKDTALVAGSLRGSIVTMGAASLIACVGCGDSEVPTSASPTPGSVSASSPTEAKADALAVIVQRAKSGDVALAIQPFVSSAPNN